MLDVEIPNSPRLLKVAELAELLKIQTAHDLREVAQNCIPYRKPPGFVLISTRARTRLADAGVDVVKIKELMGHASIVTTMRYIHATDQGKRGAITVLSEYRQKRRHKFVTDDKRQTLQPAVSH